MLILPVFDPPRRAWLWAFWTALSLGFGVFLTVLLTFALGWGWITIAAVSGAGLFVTGWVWPGIIHFCYRAWNKLAREFRRIARLWVLAVAYFLVFTPVAAAGSLLRIGAPKPGESLWTEPKAFSLDEHGHQSSARGWISGYLSWCSGASNQWAVWVLPFLFLLSVMETDEHQSSVPSNIYTLY